jgi:hypothetical protein
VKIDLSKIDKENFSIKEKLIAGDKCFLINPIGNPDWTQQNCILRSSIWNENGEPVSLGFKKFTNWLENPKEFPVPESLDSCSIVTKMDGSLIVVSKYKNELIIRTRQTFDANIHENSQELSLLLDYLAPIFEATKNLETWTSSLLFEWVSPTNKIILDYSEPDFIFIGAIEHEDYSLWQQKTLDSFAEDNNLKRPEYFSFGSINDLIDNVQKWQDKEGVVLYSNNGQSLHKIKAAAYLLKHRFKSQASLEHTLDLYCKFGYPEYGDFRNLLIKEFDYECFLLVEGFILKILEAKRYADDQIEVFKKYIDQNKELTQKDFAIKVLSENKENSSFIFEIKGKNKLSDKNYRKLIEKYV